MKFSEAVQTRFWAKVDRTQGPDACWIWQGAKWPHGYGQFRYEKSLWTAHRMAWAMTHGSIPEGKWILHACDVPSCCNPAHLHVGDHDLNMKEMAVRERSRATRLNANVVKKVRELVGLGMKQTVIAKLLGVSNACICEIVSGKKWGHVE